MRILFISAFYPPYVVGGWEQLVQDINHRLVSRGHTTRVLTSTYGVGNTPLQQKAVKRLLTLEADLVNYRPLDFFINHQKDLEHNLQVIRQQVEEFQPDVIFIHVMWNLTRGIAWEAERLCPGRVVYYIANNWPYAPNAHRAYWEDPATRPVQKIMKSLLAIKALRMVEAEEKSFPLRFERVMTVSQALKRELECNAGIPEENMEVVYNGVEVDLFTPPASPHLPTNWLSLLYAGSLVHHKGVHTAIEALAELKRQGELNNIHLTIVGSGHPAYEAGLRRAVKKYELEKVIEFWPRVSREEMPLLMKKFNVLIFPSLWEEPLARMVQEAMASGLVVIGTPTGGTPEILVNNQTGLTYPPGDSQELARRIVELRESPERMEGLARRGREIVLQKFNIERMIDEIEAGLQEVAGIDKA